MPKFIMQYVANGPDRLLFEENGEVREATREDKKDYPEEYKALKEELATKPPRLPWEERKKLLEKKDA